MKRVQNSEYRRQTTDPRLKTQDTRCKRRGTGTYAAVMTGTGTAAIATIQIFGAKGKTILEKIFRPDGDKKASYEIGKIILGTINDGERIIDQVTIGCEEKDLYAINCHGNPLITADITRLLEAKKVRIITRGQLLEKIYTAAEMRTIEIEARIAQGSAKTTAGTKLILNQIGNGLARKAEGWLKQDSGGIEKTKKQARQILERSQTARILIDGAKIAIIGPPNSGKSTLLNYLAGNVKSIVTDIAGTTLDYVTAQCRVGKLYAELTDTAGLCEDTRLKTQDSRRISNIEQGILNNEVKAAGQKAIERIAQEKSLEILGQADLLLLVLDISETESGVGELPTEEILKKPTITVLNKSDLQAKLNMFKLPKELRNCVTISAKTGEGIENLVSRIQENLGAADFNLRTAVCINRRQEELLKNLIDAKSKREAARIITKLLNGRL
jgi:tRNA modification GTPase